MHTVCTWHDRRLSQSNRYRLSSRLSHGLFLATSCIDVVCDSVSSVSSHIWTVNVARTTTRWPPALVRLLGINGYVISVQPSDLAERWQDTTTEMAADYVAPSSRLTWNRWCRYFRWNASNFRRSAASSVHISSLISIMYQHGITIYQRPIVEWSHDKDHSLHSSAELL